MQIIFFWNNKFSRIFFLFNSKNFRWNIEIIILKCWSTIFEVIYYLFHGFRYYSTEEPLGWTLNFKDTYKYFYKFKKNQIFLFRLWIKRIVSISNNLSNLNLFLIYLQNFENSRSQYIHTWIFICLRILNLNFLIGILEFCNYYFITT